MARPEFKAKVILEATISPSEDSAKVVRALENVLGRVPGEQTLTSTSAKLVTEDAGALLRMRDMLRDRHIRSAARRQLVVNRAGNSSSMMLNRQAAAAGVVALCGSPDESPLGPIYVAIKSEDLDAAVDWLTAYDQG